MSRLPRQSLSPEPFTCRKYRFSRPSSRSIATKRGFSATQSLLPDEGRGKPAPAKNRGDAAPLSLDIDEIRLAAEKISFSDLSGRTPFKTRGPDRMKVDHFSNGKERSRPMPYPWKPRPKKTVKARVSFHWTLSGRKERSRSRPFL